MSMLAKNKLGNRLARYGLMLTVLIASFALASCTKNDSKSPKTADEGDKAADDTSTGSNSGGNAAPKPGAPGAPGSSAVPGTHNPDGKSPALAIPNAQNSGASTVRYKSFTGEYNIQQIQTWVNAHRTANTAQSQNLRYAYIPFDMVNDSKTLNQARVGLWKALNHASTNRKLYTGADASDGHGLVWAIDITALWGERATTKWNTIAGGRGKQGIISYQQNERSFTPTEPVAADRLVYNVLAPNIYNVLIDNPSYEYELRRKINTKNDKIWWAAQNDAIVFGPRVSWAVETEDQRIYWATGDEFNGNERETKVAYLQEGQPSKPRFRFRNEHMLAVVGAGGGVTVASEAWLQKSNCQNDDDNCFLEYFIWGNAAQERGRAETSFVVDPGNPVNSRNVQGLKGGILLNGRSCITCHLHGAKADPSDVATAIENPESSGLSAEKISALRDAGWASNAELNTLYKRVNDGFAKSMQTIVSRVSDASTELNQEMILGTGEEVCNVLLIRCDQRKCDGGNGGRRRGG